MDAAISAGKDLQVALDPSKCIPVEGTLPDYLYAGAKVVFWYREPFEASSVFTAYQSFVNLAGDFVFQEIITRSNNTVNVMIVTANPLDSNDIKDVTLLECVMGKGPFSLLQLFPVSWFILGCRTELSDYGSVLEAELAGAKLTMVIVFEGCINPSGQYDLIDDTIGSSFQSLLFLGPDTIGERISLSTFFYTSNGEYGTLVVTFDERNNAFIFPGTWEYDENGEWGNSSDGTEGNPDPDWTRCGLEAVMLRFFLCVAAFLPAIFAQGIPQNYFGIKIICLDPSGHDAHLVTKGGSLESFDEVVAALRAGHRVTGNYNSDLCESSNTPEPVLLSVHFDTWQHTEIESEVPTVVALQSFATRETGVRPDGTFVLVYSFVSSDGHAMFDSYEIASETGLVTNNYVAQCTAGVGAFFVEKGSHQPDTTLGTYDELLTALLEGRQLTITDVATECEHPLPAEVTVAEGGSTYYQYYVLPGESYDSFETYEVLDEAFLEGKDIRVSLDSAMCISPNDTAPEVLFVGVDVVTWLRQEDVEFPGIFFSQSVVEVFGDMILQEYYVAPDNVLYVKVSIFNPIVPDDVPDVYLFQCVIGEGAAFTAPSFGRTELMDYVAVVEAELNGAKLSAEIDFNECVDPTGEIDLSGVRVGAYLQDLIVFSPATAGARLFSSAFTLSSDPISRFAYETFGVTLDASNNAIVFPGFWRYDENGEWGNAFGETFLECTLGGGLMIFQEA
ncbi:unnamed protein product [Darwinula stevensoni]|uniref:Uncharacterized protein n=1 Tax=Darwinula stevensoni TaxID=69355 RepID=A0A7R9FNT7_9CRUS|nr:unnamed protein product [Darwinula stevensoni]CAG0897185.1 unnamed protein product [Darwinula stevensoni]